MGRVEKLGTCRSGRPVNMGREYTDEASESIFVVVKLVML